MYSFNQRYAAPPHMSLFPRCQHFLPLVGTEAVFFLVSGADTMGRLAYYGMEAAGGRAIVHYFWTINGKEPVS